MKTRKILSFILSIIMIIGICSFSDSVSFAVTKGDGTYTWPVATTAEITCGLYYSKGGYHGATDFGCRIGSPVYATADGTVIKVADMGCLGSHYYPDNPECPLGSSCKAVIISGKKEGSYGNYLVIDHGNNVYSWYAHLKTGEIRVSVGDKVKQGQTIASSGNSGNSSGPHLHFELRMGSNALGARVDPRNYLTKTNPDPSPSTPPAYAVISTDYSSYAVDETVTFSFNTDGNVNVLWIYCPDGSTLHYSDVGRSYQLGFGMPGHFQALVQTWNGLGSYTSERIDFVVGPPTYARISTNDQSYHVDERVYFTFDADGTSNVLWIYCPDGSTLHYSDVGDAYDLGFGMSGHYQALVQTWNGQGYYTSDRIDFVVGSPTYANIQTDKTNYHVDEQVNFTFDTDGTVNVLWIYCPDGSTLHYSDLQDSYELGFGMSGHYQALVQAWNCDGSYTSDRIDFVIGPPTYAKIKTDKSTYDVGETVNFTFDTDGTVNVLWIYNPDGTSEHYSDLGDSYNLSFASSGTYKVLVQSWNGDGSYTSDKISIIVTNQVPDECPVHKWNDGTVTTESTCSSTGIRVYECIICGKQKTEVVDKNANNHTGRTEVRNYVVATCGKQGYTGDVYCKDCGVMLTSGSIIEKISEHVWTDFFVEQQPTCISKGRRKTVCAVCRKSRIEEIDKDSTNHVSETEIRDCVDASCTEEGFTGNVYCTACDTKLKSGTTIPATGRHSWGDGVITSTATCKENGTKSFTCTICGIEKTETIPKDSKNHDGEAELRNTKSSTCTEKGYSGDKYCKDCNALIKKGTEIKALGHKFANGKCSVCGAKDPNYKPTEKPTVKPTEKTTVKPTEKTTVPSSDKPTEKPTEAPTVKPTEPSTEKPTETPTDSTTEPSTEKPTVKPTTPSTDKPTEKPTSKPPEKTTAPTTDKPTRPEKPTKPDSDKTTFPATEKPSEVSTEPTTKAEEKLEFDDNANVDGKIDEENKKVSIVPNASAGMSLDEFKAMFKGAVSVAGEKIEKVFNGMKFTFNGNEYTFILKGDPSPDGKITAKDARSILRIAARLEQPDDVTKDAADVDSDGKVTSKEARIVLRFAAKLQSKICE